MRIIHYINSSHAFQQKLRCRRRKFQIEATWTGKDFELDPSTKPAQDNGENKQVVKNVKEDSVNQTSQMNEKQFVQHNSQFIIIFRYCFTNYEKYFSNIKH